jgi:hypothetical protein
MASPKKKKKKKKKKEVREAHTWAVEDERKSGSKEK